METLYAVAEGGCWWQVGSYVEDKSEWFSNRVPKKQRHERMVDAVLADKGTKVDMCAETMLDVLLRQLCCVWWQAYVKKTYKSIEAKTMEGRRKHVREKKQARYKQHARFQK